MLLSNDIRRAPFSEDEVTSGNHYQSAPYHPFTCGGGGGNCSGVSLVLTQDGWKCPNCDFMQDYAYQHMLDWSWRRALENSPLYKDWLDANPCLDYASRHYPDKLSR